MDPDEAGAGAHIRVHGRHLASIASKNKVYFSKQGGSKPSLESIGLEADPGGTWFELAVPIGAQTGPTLVTVETAGGVLSVEGPHFTLGSETMPPTISKMEPRVVTMLPKGAQVVIDGMGYYPHITKLTLDGEDHPIDWDRSDHRKIVFAIEPRWLETPASLSVVLHNPAPGGGSTRPETLEVVEPIHLEKAVAFTKDRIRLHFDRAIERNLGSSSFTLIGKGSGAIRGSWRMGGAPHIVELMLAVATVPGETYTVEVRSEVRSEEGGEFGTRRVSFRGFGSLPQLESEIGRESCGNDGFVDPVAVSLRHDGILVTERGGNQVQRLSHDGEFIEFFGHDGDSLGTHRAGSARGCGGTPQVPGGLSSPLGVAQSIGDFFFVADTGNDRILRVSPEEWVVFSVDVEPSPVLLGASLFFPPTGLLVTDGPARASVMALSGWRDQTVGGDSIGQETGEFDFSMDAGGLPAMAMGSNQQAMYFVEPGNHRVQLFDSPVRAKGSIGKGSVSFTGVANEGAGTAPGEFTHPCGIAVGKGWLPGLPDLLYVVDEGGGTSGGGRVQRFFDDGSLHWELPLDYRPGGVAVDEEEGILWITNRTAHKLMRYSLH